MPERMTSFREFWPSYVRDHANPTNRRLHFIGTSLVIALLVCGLFFGRPLLFLLMPIAGYGFAWAGHFLVEKNRPATFTYPLFSLAADFVMYGKTWAGKMDDEVRAATRGV